MAERITTLLQDRLPLDPDRRLKVPAIRPEDDMVTVRRRLGRYLYDSLAKDTDRETLAVGTANMIWPGCEPVDRETDAEIARDLRRTESKTGSPAIALHHPAGRIIIIGLGPHKPMLARIDYRYRLSKRTVDTVSLPSLLAARMIMGHMADPDPEREIRDMLSDDRHTWQYFRTNMDRRFDGICGLVVSCATHGVRLPDPPEPGDAKALLAWTAGAGAIGLDCDDARVKGLLAERLEWVRWTAELRLAAETILRVESDWRMNRDLARRTEAGASATVFEDKKHRDPKHDEAGQASPFAADFDRIEVEDDVDLDLFARLGVEWEALRPVVPVSRGPRRFAVPIHGTPQGGRHLPYGTRRDLDRPAPSRLVRPRAHASPRPHAGAGRFEPRPAVPPPARPVSGDRGHGAHEGFEPGPLARPRGGVRKGRGDLAAHAPRQGRQPACPRGALQDRLGVRPLPRPMG